MDMHKMPRKLWEHPDPKGTDMWKFMQESNRRYGLNLESFQDMYRWSTDRRAQFYEQLWDYSLLIHEGSYARVVDESAPISSLPRWFEGVRLNFAENVLWSRRPSDPDAGARSTLHKEDDKVAVTEVREGNSAVRHVTYGELRSQVGQLAAAMKERGVSVGDRVVMVGSHSAQTLAVFLAATWLGAVFSSSSTDMGVGGLLQRTVQVNPKFVFFDDGALYNGKVLDLREKMAGMMEGLKGCSNFDKMIVVKRFDRAFDTTQIVKTERLEQFLGLSGEARQPPPIARIGFQDPAMIFYSSGTTGIPKAIVHGVGGLLVNLVKEAQLHSDVRPSGVGLQYTTTGWIMYMSSVSYVLVGARAILYDGSPLVPDATILLRLVAEQRVTALGVSPRWMSALMTEGIVPQKVADLSSLKAVRSTGMVLPDQLFEWFYDGAFPKTVQLGNISGGTDIAGCFGMENPISPLYVGGCMGGSLGVPVAVYDHDLPEGAAGSPLPAGTAGDLVAPAAFPNVPLFLWGDAQPAPGPKYHGAYFARFDRAWGHGDFCAWHPRTGGLLLLGRSDGVLNPSGVRFGSADIYAVLERCFPADVAESLCVGQRRPRDADERVLLFLIMRPGRRLDGAMVRRVKDAIARELTKRHVPKYVFEVPEIPVTVNGKKVELPVKQIVSGKTIKASGTLLNPKSLDQFYRYQKIEELQEPQAKL